MGAPATFQQSFGLDTVLVAVSLAEIPTVGTVKDGKSDVVTAVSHTDTSGIYTFTLAKKFPAMVSGVAGITPADATPTDIVCDVSYNATTGVVTIYTRAAAVLGDPEAGSRINFLGVFSRTQSLVD